MDTRNRTGDNLADAAGGDGGGSANGQARPAAESVNDSNYFNRQSIVIPWSTTYESLLYTSCYC
jgi:hypothetical protein